MMSGLVDPANRASNHSNNRRNKRFQACISCRESKIKCLPSEVPNSCQSCLKASRTCVLPGPAKPRIKSSQKFSELERKIALLTDALAVKDSSPQLASGGSSLSRNINSLQTPAASSNESSPNNYNSHEVARSSNFSNPLSFDPSQSAAQVKLDVIADGSVRMDTAMKMFNYWRMNMHPLVPLTCFESIDDFEQTRQTTPLLFLAVLTISSTSTNPSLSYMLVQRLMQDLSQQIFVQSTPSMQVVLATILFSQYYFQPRGGATLVPSQYIYAAAAMSADLGLRANMKNLEGNNSKTATEAARVCLSEWYIVSMAATLVHRSPIIQYSTELEKVAKILSTGRTTSEGWFFSLLKLQHITESALLLLDSFNIKSPTVYDEPSTQYKTNMLLEKLQAWESEVPENVDVRLKQHGFHTTYLYIHKIAIQCFIRKIAIEKQNGQHGSSSQDAGVTGLTPAHFDCLSKCITSIRAVFDIYLSFKDSVARCLPNNYLLWNINAAVIMIKIAYFGESLTKRQSDQPPFAKTVVYYLDAIVAKLEHISRNGYLPQAKPHIKILRKLKPYYLQKRDVCINSQGDLLVEQQGAENNSAGRISEFGPHYVKPTSGDGVTTTQLNPSSSMHAQQSYGSVSNGDWMATTEPLYNPPTTSPFPNQALDSTTDVCPAQDPYTYENTDWDNLVLDSDTMQQLDSFIWDGNDTAWMNSLL